MNDVFCRQEKIHLSAGRFPLHLPVFHLFLQETFWSDTFWTGLIETWYCKLWYFLNSVFMSSKSSPSVCHLPNNSCPQCFFNKIYLSCWWYLYWSNVHIFSSEPIWRNHLNLSHLILLCWIFPPKIAWNMLELLWTFPTYRMFGCNVFQYLFFQFKLL